MRQRNANKGFIGILLLIVIAILVVSYFNIDLQSLVEKPQTQKNAAYVTTTTTSFWNSYLQKPASYLWNTVFVGLLWNSFIDNMTRIKNGQPTTLQEMAPQIQTSPK